MLRKLGLIALAAVLLAGCDKPRDKEKEVTLNMPVPMAGVRDPNRLYAPPPAFVPPPDIVIQTNAPNPNALFTLRHDLTLSMPHDAVAARFAAARDACLKVKALHCVLTSASLSAAKTMSANLQVALPHEQVPVFEKKLLQALPQDVGGKVEITARTTSTENETAAASDIARQMEQATAYRDKLEELSKRPGLTVEEVLKIHEALSEAQNAVENAVAAKRASDSNITLERVNLSFEEKVVPVQRGAFDGFWSNAKDVFLASIADMALRLINLLPWLPVAFLLAWLVTRFMRRVRIKRRQEPPTT